MTKRLFLSAPHVGVEERELLLDAFDSNWIAPLGPHVDGFELEMCQRLGCGHAAALSSGTSALHLALLMLEVSSGDEVWCSSLTFAASANVIRYVDAVPVFIDAERRSWNLDPVLLAEGLREANHTNRLPKAVIVVDLYGQCADYDPILSACAEYDIPVLEDAAEALGATYRGVAAGTLGAMSVLSFNGNKIMTTGGGGMLLSDRAEWIEKARFLATQARDPAPHYQHSVIGYNYRLSNLLAAIGRGQLRSLDSHISARRRVNERYRKALADLPGVEFLPEADYGRSNCWLTCLTVDSDRFGASREDIRLHLESSNIESRPVWKPMHLQPVFSKARCLGGDVAEDLFTRGLCLPSGSSMSDTDVDRVVKSVREVARR